MVKRKAFLRTQKDLEGIILKICKRQQHFTIDVVDEGYIITLYDNSDEPMEKLAEAIDNDTRYKQLVVGTILKENQRLIFSKKKNEPQILIMTTV